MKALAMVRPEARALELIDVPKPEVAPQDVLVRVELCGICSTDMAIFRWVYKGRQPIEPPNILGHEISGVVEDVGAGVTGIGPGTRVVVDAFWQCGICSDCRAGRPNVCANWRHVGASKVGGGFAEYIAAPVSHVHPVAAHVAPSDVALIEPLSIAVHGLELARPIPGQRVAVVGPGPLGLLQLAAFGLAGVRDGVVIGLPQIDDVRLDIARHLGARDAIAASGPEAATAALESLGGVGADIVVEAGGTQESFELALELAAPGGTLLVIGFAQDAHIRPMAHLIRKYLKVFAVSASRREHYGPAIEWLERGIFEPSIIATHTLPLANGMEGFEALERGEAGKVLIAAA